MPVANYNQKQLHILEHAAHEFLHQGYTAASTNTIAKTAVVAKGLVFHYFKNKETLYMDVLELSFQKVTDMLNSKLLTLSTYMEPFALIYELIVIKDEIRASEPLYGAVVLDALQFSHALDLSPELRTFILDLQQRYDLIFASFLDGLFIQERIKAPYKKDERFFYRIMIILEAAYQYEKGLLLAQGLPIPKKGISLQYYEKMLKEGFLRL